MRNILVTGCAGFIGYHLVKELIKTGDLIVGVDNINNYYSQKLKYMRLNELGVSEDILGKNKFGYSEKLKYFHFYKSDISKKSKLNSIFKKYKFDIVVNLAAQAGVRYSIENPTVYLESNVIGFFNLLENCKVYNVKHLLFASSSSVYGANTTIPFRESDSVDFPISFYAATKKSNELMAHSYSHLYGIPVTGMRFFSVYGPWGRPDMAYFKFAKNIVLNEPIKVYNEGVMQRDFTYISDIIDGILLLIDKPALQPIKSDLLNSKAKYVVYNFGNNKPVNLMKFISTLEKLIGKKAIIEKLQLQDGDMKITCADISELRKNIGYSPKVNLNRGLEKFVEWYLKYKGNIE